jgi:hypothetical protein
MLFKKNLPKQKISRVLFLPSKSGDDDHQSGMPIARHLKRPTRKLSFTFGSGAKRATSPSPAKGGIGMNPSLFGLALKWGLPSPMLPPDRVVSYTTFSPLAKWPVFFLWHFPSLSVPRVTRHFALESSDFPSRSRFKRDRDDHLFCFGKSNSLFLTSL